MRKRLALFLAAAALLVAPAHAGPTELAERGRAAEGDLVTALEGVGKWCNARKLFGKRDEVYELILELQPGHEKARRTLKFEEADDGSWEQDARYKRPRNWAPKLFAEYGQRRLAALHAYRDAVLGVCVDARTGADLAWAASTTIALFERFPGDAKLLAGLKRSLMQHLALLQEAEVPTDLVAVSTRLLKYFPDDAEVRTALGEMLVDGRWLLPATAQAEKNRARYRDVAAAALKGIAAPQETDPTDEEKAAGVAWNGVHETAHMRLLGTTTDASLRQIAISCEAAAAFFQSVFRKEPDRAPAFTFYVFSRREPWLQFVRDYAAFPAARRDEALATRSSGFGVGPVHYAALPVGSAEAERDLCVDVTFQSLLQRTFNPYDARDAEWRSMPGWVRIGLSDYLTFRLIGTRILTTVGGEYGRPAQNLGERVPDKDTAWLKAALAIVERDGVRGTRLMLGRTLGAFGRDDAVTSFAFASWLLEGRPRAAAAILAEVGRRRPIQEVVLEVTGLTLEALHVELLRWLEEMTAAR